MSTNKPKKIRLGICMAGAVSAGAYTAGVMDYLVETLERWEQKKKEIRGKIAKGEVLSAEDKLIPMHDVVIEVLSGASAGGMTAAIMAYSFNDGSFINRRNNNLIGDNYNVPLDTDEPSKLYDCWVNMVDDDQSDTFGKLMNADDVVAIQKMKAILNSKPIDDIALKAVPEKINFQPPGYISEFLSVILSVTNLEGVPIDIRFSNVDGQDPTRNVLKMHSGFLHYQFKKQEIAIDFPAEIITEEVKSHLADAAKATGAFPFGLSNRKIIVKGQFFEDFKGRLKKNYQMEVNLDLGTSATYVFNAVDGGTINNEPIGTTVKILESKEASDNKGEQIYTVLIDPFPTVTNATKELKYKEPEEYTLSQQFFKIIGAIRNQSMFKQEDLLTGLKMADNRFLIYPAKRKYYFLACGEVEGFSGFLKKAFRKHDYQLGRKNCQDFLRYYFGEKREKLEAVTDIPLTEDQMKVWGYNINYADPEKQAIWKFPLVPDMLLLNSNRPEIVTPEYDGLTIDELNKISGQIKARVERLVDSTYPAIAEAGKGIHGIVGTAMRWFPRFFKKKIVNFATKKIDTYLEDTFSPQAMKQDFLVTKYIEIIVKEGRQYQKTKGVTAEIAKVAGEKVITIIDGEIETENIASAGDFIVTNPTGERFIIKPDEFHKRYVHVEGNYYAPTSKTVIWALQLTKDNIRQYHLDGFRTLIDNPGKPTHIEPTWKDAQMVQLNDYLVCPPSKREVYCINQVVFGKTYEEIR